MDEAFRRKLPPNILEIVDRIEAFAVGKRIAVHVDPALARAQSRVTPIEARVELPHDGDIEGLVHEILHVERGWPDQIPQMIPADPALSGLAGYVDDVLEHLVIFPKQWALGFGNVDRLKPGFRSDWAPNSTFRTIANRWARHLNLLILYLPVAHFARDSTEHREAKQCLEREGLTDLAQRFYDRIAAAINSKERMVGIAVDTLNIRRGIRLARSNPRVERLLPVPIPES